MNSSTINGLSSSVEHSIERVIISDFKRPDPDAISKLAQSYTGHVLDRQNKKGAMDPAIKPLSTGMRLCGPATTCSCPDLDVRRMAIDLAHPGDVLVIAAGGDCGRACFGDGTAMHMYHRGLAGVIIDGATRDAGRIRAMQFPTFAKCCTPRNYRYPTPDSLNFSADPTLLGANIPIICGGVIVNPGDVILADDDGAIVVPRDDVGLLSSDVLETMWKKDSERLRRLGQEYNVGERLRERGFAFR